jgi:nucleoside-diphosphate-sugar epimerase
MNILFAGATGRTGLHLVQYLIDQGHKPTALVREGSNTSALSKGVGLRQDELTDLQAGVRDAMEVVIFEAGSGGSTGPEMTDKVDRDGAKCLIDMAHASGRHDRPFRRYGAGYAIRLTEPEGAACRSVRSPADFRRNP